MIDDIQLEKVEVLDVPGFEPSDRTFVAAHAAGHVGWYGPLTAAYGRVAEWLAGAVTGAPVTNHYGLLEVLRGACRPGDKADSWAAGAVDCAVWDLHGRLAGVPVAELLSPGPVSAVPAYASWLGLDLTRPGNLGAVAATAAHPWRFTKWGLRLDQPDPVRIGAAGLADLVCRIADHAGGKVALDALGTWTPWLAQLLAERVDPSVLVWLEDPLPRHNLDQYCELAASGLPLAVGERMLIGDDDARLIELVRPAAFTLDVVGCGGLTRAVDLWCPPVGVSAARQSRRTVRGVSRQYGMHRPARYGGSSTGTTARSPPARLHQTAR